MNVSCARTKINNYIGQTCSHFGQNLFKVFLDSLLIGISDSNSIGTTQKIVKVLSHSEQSSDMNLNLLSFINLIFFDYLLVSVPILQVLT